MRITSSAPGNLARSCRSRTNACCSPSAQATCSSGVDFASGSASSTADGSACRDRISSSRAAVYMPSSKPYQRSPKNVWPLISPASAAPSSFIFTLMNEWPVFHRSGLPPCFAIQGLRCRVDFTS